MKYARRFVKFVTFSLVLTSFAVEAFERGALTIETQTGKHVFVVDLANTPDDRRQGLMGRTDIAPGYGMLFDFRGHERVAMWMKDTPTSLDMIFINEHGNVTGIVANTKPFSMNIIQVEGSVAAVLEVLAGTANTLGIVKGNMVRHPIFEAP